MDDKGLLVTRLIFDHQPGSPLVRKLLKPSLSPVDLAMPPVEEGKPAGVRKAASAPNLRLVGAMNCE
jgi:hypothetical protein